MGFRFRKSINVGKHFRINLSKKGIGYSYGVKGYRHTVSADGKEKDTFTIPGTGISHVSSSNVSSSNTPAPRTHTEISDVDPQKRRSGCWVCILFIIFLFSVPYVIRAIKDNYVNKIPDPPDRTAAVVTQNNDPVLSFEDNGTSFLQIGNTISLILNIQSSDILPQSIVLGGVDETIVECTSDVSEPGKITYNITALTPGIVDLTAFTTDGTYKSPTVQIIVDEPGSLSFSNKNTLTNDSSGNYYIVNTSTKKIHEYNCSYAPEIGSPNRDTSENYFIYLSEGYIWCKYCH